MIQIDGSPFAWLEDRGPSVSRLETVLTLSPFQSGE
jgi:hypothetical protein